MRAGYLIAPGQIEVRDDAVPAAEPGGVVVRVRVALTDGTDLKAFRRGHPQMPMPTRFGHEFSGDVAAVGEGVTAFAVGDAIACVHSAPCGECYWCARGREELCEHVMATKILGAYAEYVAVPPHIVARNAFRKPAGLSYEAAAFLEPLACVVHSLRDLAPRAGRARRRHRRRRLRHPPRAGCAAFVRGAGLLIGAQARADGRRERGGRRGARRARAHARPDDRRRPRWSDGRGADAVVECTGTKDAWEAAPSLVARGGTASLFGGLPSGTRVSFDAARLHYDGVRIISPFHFSPRSVREAFDLLAAAAIDVAPLISDTTSSSGWQRRSRRSTKGAA